MPNLIAYACSDLHLDEKVPEARKGEKDWFACQENCLNFISETVNGEVPLILAGDLFHHPKVSPRIEKLAMQFIGRQDTIMIPGQHDLPNHMVRNIEQSSYGVVEYHRKEVHARVECGIDFQPVCYPYGSEFVKQKYLKPSVVVIHHLAWHKEEPYPGAPESGNVKSLLRAIGRPTFIVAGDNHKGFTTTIGGVTIVNCGSMMRRTADQVDYKPRMYALYDDGTTKAVYFPIEDDVISREHREEMKARDERVVAFVKKMKGIKIDLSFEANMDRFCKKNKVKEAVVEQIQEAING